MTRSAAWRRSSGCSAGPTAGRGSPSGRRFGSGRQPTRRSGPPFGGFGPDAHGLSGRSPRPCTDSPPRTVSARSRTHPPACTPSTAGAESSRRRPPSAPSARRSASRRVLRRPRPEGKREQRGGKSFMSGPDSRVAFVEPISFARGVPAPECLALEELADCARAAIERDGATALNYGPAGGYAPLREWIADRHRVEPERVVLTNGSLQGFRFLAELLSPTGTVIVEAPTYDRPLKILAELEAEVICVPLDEEPAVNGGVVPVHDPDLPEPDRPDAVQGAPQGARRACPRRIARARGRPVRPRPLRGQAAADGVRAGARPERRLQLVLLEDGRPGVARRIPRSAERPGRTGRGGRDRLLHHARAALAGDRLRVPAQREPSSRTSSASTDCCASAATR